MKIKKQLMIAFLISTLVPVVLSIGIGAMLLKYQDMVMKQSYNVSGNTMQLIVNPMHILNKITQNVYEDLCMAAERKPEQIENKRCQEEWNQHLQTRRSFLVLRKAEQYIYIGNIGQFTGLEDDMPEFGAFDQGGGNLYLEGENPFFIRYWDFIYQDGSKGTFFIFTDFNALLPQIKHSVLEFAVSLPLVLMVTAMLLVFWIYRSILYPLNVLRNAAHEITDGNLDSPIHSTFDNEIGLLCYDFEQMRQKLKEQGKTQLQYEQDMRDLISNISHDLKTPLTAIKGYAEGLMDGIAVTEERRKKYLQTIYNKAEDMTYLVDELSFYSRIDCNTVPYAFRKLNLDAYFSDCVQDLCTELEWRNIELNYMNYTDKDLEIVADPEQIKRVIHNIIGNSIKYIEKPKGMINIRIWQTGQPQKSQHVLIEIEDNGIGVTMEEAANIFERFYRTDTSRNSSRGGSGLGLAIVKKIIEDHGGNVYATGKEGVGTCIHFTLMTAKKDAKLEKGKEERI